MASAEEKEPVKAEDDAADNWETADLTKRISQLKPPAPRGTTLTSIPAPRIPINRDFNKGGTIESPERTNGRTAEMVIDKTLVEQLQRTSSGERLTVLKYEELILKFLGQKRETVLEFSQGMTAFQRMLAAKVAEHYGLAAEVISDPPEQATVRVHRTASSRWPQFKLSDVKPVQEAEESAPVVVGIMKRDNSSRSVNSASPAPRETPVRSHEEREAEYERAKQRIFQSGSARSLADGGASQRASSNDLTAAGAGADEDAQGGGDQPRAAADGEYDQQAGGSDGGDGGASSEQAPASGFPPRPNSGPRELPRPRGAQQGGGPGQRKALIRDREKDLMDPDFRRGGGGGGGRYHHGQHQVQHHGGMAYYNPSYAQPPTTPYPGAQGYGGGGGGRGPYDQQQGRYDGRGDYGRHYDVQFSLLPGAVGTGGYPPPQHGQGWGGGRGYYPQQQGQRRQDGRGGEYGGGAGSQHRPPPPPAAPPGHRGGDQQPAQAGGAGEAAAGAPGQVQAQASPQQGGAAAPGEQAQQTLAAATTAAQQQQHLQYQQQVAAMAAGMYGAPWGQMGYGQWAPGMVPHPMAGMPPGVPPVMWGAQGMMVPGPGMYYPAPFGYPAMPGGHAGPGMHAQPHAADGPGGQQQPPAAGGEQGVSGGPAAANGEGGGFSSAAAPPFPAAPS